MSFEDFSTDAKTISAVRDKLIIIGEVAKHIPVKIREAHPEIAWWDMAGMRISSHLRISKWIWQCFTRQALSGFPSKNRC